MRLSLVCASLTLNDKLANSEPSGPSTGSPVLKAQF
jgi:hypothetical protein